MAPGAQNLHVRRHERYACHVPAEVVVASSCASQVNPARAASGGVAVTVVDYAAGGLGMRSGVFLPRGCALIVRLPGPAERPVEARVEVRRVGMVDQTPTYYLGASFAGADHAEVLDAIRTKASSELAPRPA